MPATKIPETAMETKHTPGPWTFETVRTAVGICHKIGAFPTGNAIKPISYACVYEDGMSKQVDWDRGRLDSELFANARLIAAAPDLLEAARAAQCDCSTSARESGHNIDCWFPALQAAIAKAEGRAISTAHQSALSCGCDPREGYLCARHRGEDVQA